MPDSAAPFEWPKEGVSRVPYYVYSDREIYDREQERIFRGPAWHFLGLEQQIPEPGSYILTDVGDAPVILLRDQEGKVGAFVNRCAHKGTQILFKPEGKVRQLMCVYHNWCYDLQGRLTTIAFERGVQGKGGMPSGFAKGEHGLTVLRTHSISGLVFGTFSATAPSFEDYVGPDMIANIRRVCGRPIRILGQYSQMLHSNWKLYIENVQDPYHASILHAFNGVMKLDRLTMDGGVMASPNGWHHIAYSKMSTDKGDAIYGREGTMRSAEINAYGHGLRDRSMVDFWDDFGDNVSLTVQTTFPTFVIQQLRNSLAFRQVVPKGPFETQLNWIAFGYADDDERKTALRLKQANFMGPAGLISMEDGMIGGLVQRGIAGDPDKATVLELGGGSVHPIAGSRASESSVRGFWAGYRELMGI
jgi:anthranilate 1,2-dioxygenase large subunit/terephthalate 1,2-dioxygenase oxygenase component alpha subunit